jgi:hypothetical protein
MRYKQVIVRQIIVALAAGIMSISTASAGVEKLIKNVFPSGTMSNVTKSAIVNEQSAGHLMGGSVIIKTPAEPGLQLIHAQSPSCKMGGLPCGAQFEILGGGLSIVNSAELMRHLKGLVANASTYGGIMLIQTMCPQCEDIMTWLDGKADWINNLAKTDCEDMARLADGMLGKITAGSRATRQSAAVLNGDGKDMADFAAKSKTDDGSNPTAGTPELESLLGDQFNLVWKALDKKAANSEENNPLKELLMSISGTIIGKKDAQAKRTIIHKKSLVSKELIEEFIGVKSTGMTDIKLYACDETTLCLEPTAENKKIKASETLMGRVGELLTSIAVKVRNDEGPLTKEEETLVSLSSLSLITKIELDLSSYSDIANATAAQTEFVEALCFDVVTSYLAQLLEEVSAAVAELSYVQIADSGVFAKFDGEIRETMRALSAAKNQAFKRYDLIAQTKARIRQEVKYFEFKFEEFCSGQNES